MGEQLDPLGTLRARTGWYDPAVLQAAEALLAKSAGVREVRTRDLREGMRLAADLRTVTGIVLVPRDTEVNATIIQRIANFGAGIEGETTQVYVAGDDEGHATPDAPNGTEA